MQGEWTQERLEALGWEWQERLALRDWLIEWRLVTPDVLRGDYALCQRPVIAKRRAIISLANPGMLSDVDPTGDPEVSVVHELLHLHFWGVFDAVERIATGGGALVRPLVDMAYEEAREHEERAVCHLSTVLVALKRGGDHGPQGGVPPPGAQGPGADGAGKAGGPAPADNGPDPQDPHPEAAAPPAP